MPQTHTPPPGPQAPQEAPPGEAALPELTAELAADVAAIDAGEELAGEELEAGPAYRPSAADRPACYAAAPAGSVAACEAGWTLCVLPEGHAGPCVYMPADVVRVRIAWAPENPDPDNPRMCRCGATAADPYCFCGC